MAYISLEDKIFFQVCAIGVTTVPGTPPYPENTGWALVRMGLAVGNGFRPRISINAIAVATGL